MTSYFRHPIFHLSLTPIKLIITSSKHISSASIWQITSICIYWPCNNDVHKIGSHLLEFSATRNFLKWCYSRKFIHHKKFSKVMLLQKIYPPKFYYHYLLLKIKPHAFCICIHTVPPSYLPREEALKKWQLLGLISPNARWKLWTKFLWKFILRPKLRNRICITELITPSHIKVPSPATALVRFYILFESHLMPWC